MIVEFGQCICKFNTPIIFYLVDQFIKLDIIHNFLLYVYCFYIIKKFPCFFPLPQNASQQCCGQCIHSEVCRAEGRPALNL